MGSLSIFNIGTGHHQGEANNLLVALHRDCTSRSAVGLTRTAGGNFKFINDGPGSADPQADWNVKLASLIGAAQGTGSTRGVMATTDRMVELFRITNPQEVFICGHSRGAIVSIRIAAKLCQIDPLVPVHLFLVDPVKRMTRGTDQFNRELGPNVRNVRCVVMENVDDNGLYKHMSLKTRVPGEKRKHLSTDHFVRMPGTHGTATQVDAPIGQVTFQFARRCLAEWNAPVGAGLWNDAKLCNEYFKIQTYNPLVRRRYQSPMRQINDGGKFKLAKDQTRMTRLDGLGITNRFHGHELFVNEHHFDLFRAEFPLIARTVMDPMHATGAGGAWNQEVSRLRGWAPDGYRLINDLYGL